MFNSQQRNELTHSSATSIIQWQRCAYLRILLINTLFKTSFNMFGCSMICWFLQFPGFWLAGLIWKWHTRKNKQRQTRLLALGRYYSLMNQHDAHWVMTTNKIKQRAHCWDSQCGLTLPVLLGDGNFISSRLQVVGFNHAHFLLEHLKHTGDALSKHLPKPLD